MGPTALRPIRKTKQWSSGLLKNTSVTAGDLNPHSADQKHQSLNSVILTARPGHFHIFSFHSGVDLDTDVQPGSVSFFFFPLNLPGGKPRSFDCFNLDCFLTTTGSYCWKVSTSSRSFLSTGWPVVWNKKLRYLNNWSKKRNCF